MRVLLSWIGAQDPWIPAGGRTAGKLQRFPETRPVGATDGPIHSFLGHAGQFDLLYLLFNPAMAESGAVAAISRELAARHPDLKVVTREVSTDDPRAYAPLYRGMRAVCAEALADHGDSADYNIFLSPGTPQMHAIWVLLSKTIFPATAWQGSDHPGKPKAETVQIPFDVFEELAESIELEQVRANTSNIPGLILSSPAMRQLVENVQRVAPWNQPVLLLGETGTGKSRIANLVHSASPRHDNEFVTIECTSIPGSLLESEMFGHVRGAFTGATRSAEGRFRSAQGGTVFLEEIGDLPLDLQPKLLRIIQEKRLTPVGGNREESVDIRIVAATNRDLARLTAEGKFREDLFYRLNTFTFTVPPLRHRRDEIQPLADYFLEKINADRKSLTQAPLRLLPAARRFLDEYDWPGNIRQLQNAITHLGALSRDTRVSRGAAQHAAHATRGALKSINSPIITLDLNLEDGLEQILDNVEETVLKTAKAAAGTQKKAGRLLKLNSQQSFQSHWSKYSNSDQGDDKAEEPGT